MSKERIHTVGKPFKCKQCEKCFKAARQLKIHERIHTGEKPFKCKQCDKCFNQRASLKIHERIHTGEKPFKCKQYDKCFSSAQPCHGTIQDECLNQNEEYICWICQEKLESEKLLSKHYHDHIALLP